MKKISILFTILLLTVGVGYFTIHFYSYIFAVEVDGKIEAVERVIAPTAILGDVPSSQIFSYAVAIKNAKGEIYTASSEDRQWAVAKAGMCASAKFFPYPPWEFDKANTYFGARLIKLKECK
jgi:hypothetical protein